MSADSVKMLLSGRVLARSAVWNFIGLAAPIIVGIIAIPQLIEGMGKERFGLLTLIWMGIGYFSLFDMGLGRALTKLVSEKLGAGETKELGPLVWTALFLIGLLGVLGALLAYWGSPFIIERILNVEDHLEEEAILAFRVLALGIPFVVSTSALVGILQAHQKFATIALIRMPMGLLTYLGPWVSVQFSPNIMWATAVILGARLIAFFIYSAATLHVQVELRRPSSPVKAYFQPLLGYGGWLTVSSVIGPLMTYFDRFFIGSVLTLTAVTYYVTPYEVLSRIQILPQSILAVLFPAFATSMTASRERMEVLYAQSTKILILLMLPTVGLFFLIAPEALALWLGEDFAETSTRVVQWLALGWLINILAQPSATVLRSCGFARSVALSHLAELIPYMILLWLMTMNFGITGTAIAWAVRVLFDMVILNQLTRYHLPELRGSVMRSYRWALMILCGFLVLLTVESLALRLAVLAAIMSVSGVLLWPTLKASVLSMKKTALDNG